MNREEVKRIVRLVVRALAERNLLNGSEISGSQADNRDSSSTGEEIINHDPGQVLTAGKVRNIAGRRTEKIVVPISTIITDLAVEEAEKLKLEIVQE